MRPIDVDVDLTGQVLRPSFHDLEIREILFCQDNVILRIGQQFSFAEINMDVDITEFGLFYLMTNHSQNVIDKMYIVDISSDGFVHKRAEAIFGRAWDKSARKLLYIQPASGPEMLISCKEVRIFER